MPATKNRHGRRGSKAETPSDDTRRYGSTSRVVSGRCPMECPATFAADDQAQLDAAVQDHLENAHDYPADDKAEE